MKKLLLFLYIILLVFQGFSQSGSLTLTFQARDGITQNSLALDSVIVKNLMENCDTTLYDAVSVLTLNISWPVGMGELSSLNAETFIVMQNVPNPFQGTTMVRVYLKNDLELNLALYDDQGKILSQFHNELKTGWHGFAISTEESRLLFLKVSDNATSKTVRIMSAAPGNEGERITIIGQSGQGSEIKSVQDSAGFIFYLGNQLRYTAYVDGYCESIITDNPLSSGGYTFDMVAQSLPVVWTTPVTNLTYWNATSGGNVVSDGGGTVTARGVCWSTNPSPAITGSHSSDGIDTGLFTSNVDGLIANVKYYLRAYATNSVGTAYGNEVTFYTLPYPCPGIESLEYENQTYHTVQIGTQCWLLENLNVGIELGYCGNQTNNGIIEKYCPDGVTANCDNYGGLYQWAEMVQYLNGASLSTSWNPLPTGHVQGICPEGWHIPTEEEWCMIAGYIDTTATCNGPYMYYLTGTDVGIKMKYQTGWFNSGNGTNASGFSARPAGCGNNACEYFDFNRVAFFWTATEYLAQTAYYRDLEYDLVQIYHASYGKTFGFSVRCLKN